MKPYQHSFTDRVTFHGTTGEPISRPLADEVRLAGPWDAEIASAQRAVAQLAAMTADVKPLDVRPLYRSHPQEPTVYSDPAGVQSYDPLTEDAQEGAGAFAWVVAAVIVAVAFAVAGWGTWHWLKAMGKI